MSHNLNYNSKTEKHSFFSVKEKAWHGLGTIIEKYPNSAEAIKKAGLDYTVEKRNLFTYGDDTTPETEDNDIVMEWRLDVPNHFCNCTQRHRRSFGRGRQGLPGCTECRCICILL